MKEEKFIYILKKELKISIDNIHDSFFDPKYNLSETDFLYLIYVLLNNKIISKEKLAELLTCRDITFCTIYDLT